MVQHSLQRMEWILILALLLIGAGAARAQGLDLPFMGVVVDHDAELRSRPGPDSYPVGRIRVGSQVQVQDLEAGWYRITPPAGVFSYIAKSALEIAGDGETGTVRAETWVLAAHRNGPAQSVEQQVELRAGQAVRIVGDEGDYYRIMPPAGAAVYLPPGGLRRAKVDAVTPAVTAVEPVAGAATASAVSSAVMVPPMPPVAAQPEVPAEAPAVTPRPALVPAAEATPPAVAAATAPQAAPASTPAPTPTAADNLLEPVSATLAAVEQELAAAGRLPLEQQPLEALLRTYEELYEDGRLVRHDQRIVRGRIAQLRYRVKVAQALQDLESTRAQAAATQAQAPAPAEARPAFTETGRLTVSGIYSGRNMPLLYRLVNARTGRTIAYIAPGEGFDAAAMLGQIVTVEGELVLDPALQTRTVQVRSMTVQTPGAQASAAG